MAVQTSRRQLLGAMAIAPMVAVPAFAAAAASTSDFYRLVAEAEQAENASTMFHEKVWEPAYKETSRRCEALPHTTASYKDYVDVECTMSTAVPRDVSFAECMVRLTTHDNDGMPLSRAQHLAARKRQGDNAPAYRKIVAADRRRKRAAEQIREASLYPHTRQSEKYNHRAAGLYSAAIACPVASLAELHDKIALIERLGMEEDHESFVGIAADVARLARKAVK